MHGVPIARRGETGPPGPRFELLLRPEQRSLAAHAAVHARLVVIPVLPRKRPLGPLAPRHFVLLGRKLRPPFSVRFRNLIHWHTSRITPPPKRGSLAPPLSPSYTGLSCFTSPTRFDSGSGLEPDRHEWA